MRKIHRLDISWSTSRGADTYGYNICRLDDSESGKRYRTIGGGYDMIGTVFGQWLQENYSSELRALAENKTRIDCGYSVKGYYKLEEFYGLTYTPEGYPRLDGACGISSMIRIAEACGLEVQWSGDRKGRTRAYYVQKAGA